MAGTEEAVIVQYGQEFGGNFNETGTAVRNPGGRSYMQVDANVMKVECHANNGEQDKAPVSQW